MCSYYGCDTWLCLPWIRLLTVEQDREAHLASQIACSVFVLVGVCMRDHSLHKNRNNSSRPKDVLQCTGQRCAERHEERGQLGSNAAGQQRSSTHRCSDVRAATTSDKYTHRNSSTWRRRYVMTASVIVIVFSAVVSFASVQRRTSSTILTMWRNVTVNNVSCSCVTLSSAACHNYNCKTGISIRLSVCFHLIIYWLKSGSVSE